MTVTDDQKSALVALHAYLDRHAVQTPGQPDTAALREARTLRTSIEAAFPDAFPPRTPLVAATT